MTESLSLRGTMKGHSDWVTCISTTLEQGDVLLSGSRDKSIIMWTLEGSESQISLCTGRRPAAADEVPDSAIRGYGKGCQLRWQPD